MAKSKKIGAPCKYPWAKWLKPESKHLLQRGKDFHCSVRSMVVYLYQRASKEGRTVSVTAVSASKLCLKVG